MGSGFFKIGLTGGSRKAFILLMILNGLNLDQKITSVTYKSVHGAHKKSLQTYCLQGFKKCYCGIKTRT
jgi:hypothetical protein